MKKFGHKSQKNKTQKCEQVNHSSTKYKNISVKVIKHFKPSSCNANGFFQNEVLPSTNEIPSETDQDIDANPLSSQDVKSVFSNVQIMERQMNDLKLKFIELRKQSTNDAIDTKSKYLEKNIDLMNEKIKKIEADHKQAIIAQKNVYQTADGIKKTNTKFQSKVGMQTSNKNYNSKPYSTFIARPQPSVQNVKFSSPRKVAPQPCPKSPGYPDLLKIGLLDESDSSHELEDSKISYCIDPDIDEKDFNSKLKIGKSCITSPSTLKTKFYENEALTRNDGKLMLDMIEFRRKSDESATIIERRRKETDELYAIIDSLNNNESTAELACVKLKVKQHTSRNPELKTPQDNVDKKKTKNRKSSIKISTKSDNNCDDTKPITSLTNLYQNDKHVLSIDELQNIQEKSKMKMFEILNISPDDLQTKRKSFSENVKPEIVKTKSYPSLILPFNPNVAMPLNAPVQRTTKDLILTSPKKCIYISTNPSFGNLERIETAIKTIQPSDDRPSIVNFKIDSLVAESASPKLSKQHIPGIAILPTKPKPAFGKQSFASIIHEEEEVKHEDTDVSASSSNIHYEPQIIAKVPDINLDPLEENYNSEKHQSHLLSEQLIFKIKAREIIEEQLLEKISHVLNYKAEEAEVTENNDVDSDLLHQIVNSVVQEKIDEILSKHTPVKLQTSDDVKEKEEIIIEEDSSVQESVETPQPTPPSSVTFEPESSPSIGKESKSSLLFSPVKESVTLIDAETQVSIHSTPVSIPTPEPTPFPSISEDEKLTDLDRSVFSEPERRDVETFVSVKTSTSTKLSMSDVTSSNMDVSPTPLSTSIDESLSETEIIQVVKNAGRSFSKTVHYLDLNNSSKSYSGWKTIFSDASSSEGEIKPTASKIGMEQNRQRNISNHSPGEVQPTIRLPSTKIKNVPDTHFINNKKGKNRSNLLSDGEV